jgi:hypothetical protein
MQDVTTNNVQLATRVDDQVLTMSLLSRRWNCTQRVAAQRVKEHGIPIVRFNDRIHGVLLSAVMQLEDKLSQPA